MENISSETPTVVIPTTDCIDFCATAFSTFGFSEVLIVVAVASLSFEELFKSDFPLLLFK
ncbi:hypothetical protein WFJ11_00285 [Parvimonas micra]|uniref:hypothetical protein n=1 Tax=Parvimonas micra TaxID=33033 RepID=UPI0030CC94A9